MKKALLLLSFVHLLAACTNDIEILPMMNLKSSSSTL